MASEQGPITRYATHEVLNQPTPLVDFSLFTSDKPLLEAIRREGAAWAEPTLAEFGQKLGSQEAILWGVQANEYTPKLKTHDRYGHRIDEVEFHPAWHELMSLSMRYGVHNLPWREPREGAQVARAAMLYMAGANESGHCCPLSMTYSVVPALRKQPELLKEWEPKLFSTQYDPRFRPMQEKSSVLIGMAMTEKQGGSDVRANTTRAVPAGPGGPGNAYLLTGHKWFCSAPMSDAFLVLAQAPGGLSCFLLPRWTPDDVRNRLFIQRLKDKLGNRSNASSEVEFDGAYARMVGEEGRGVATIIEMVSHTRLDCALQSASLMRLALTYALHHTSHRAAFKKTLVDQPLMRNVLTDLALESEAATALVMRLARAYDRRDESAFEAGFRRIGTAVAKYWLGKRAPAHVAESLECLGGSGYVEESLMPRLYREAPLSSIWEGSGNVICLDVLRAMTKEPGSTEALVEEIRRGLGGDKRLDAYAHALAAELSRPGDELESQARRLVEKLALALQASLLVRYAPPAVADAFCASRLTSDSGRAFGTLPPKLDFQAVISRALP